SGSLGPRLLGVARARVAGVTARELLEAALRGLALVRARQALRRPAVAARVGGLDGPRQRLLAPGGVPVRLQGRAQRRLRARQRGGAGGGPRRSAPSASSACARAAPAAPTGAACCSRARAGSRTVARAAAGSGAAAAATGAGASAGSAACGTGAGRCARCAAR